MSALEEYYSHYLSTSNITSKFNLDAEHTFPTMDYGNQCSQSRSPYISKCDYDGAGEGLNQLYSSMKKGTSMSSNVLAFDQTDFFKGSDTSLGDLGYIYVPTACATSSTPCSLHIALHGCEQTLDDIDTDFVMNAGYNDWAEESNIIVLYPQVSRSNKITLNNPNGCWDWWAYTNSDYATKSEFR